MRALASYVSVPSVQVRARSYHAAVPVVKDSVSVTGWPVTTVSRAAASLPASPSLLSAPVAAPGAKSSTVRSTASPLAGEPSQSLTSSTVAVRASLRKVQVTSTGSAPAVMVRESAPSSAPLKTSAPSESRRQVSVDV